MNCFAIKMVLEKASFVECHTLPVADWLHIPTNDKREIERWDAQLSQWLH